MLKVNILRNDPNNIIEGYYNVDAEVQPAYKDKVQSTIKPHELMTVFDAGEIEELVVHDVIRYYRRYEDILSYWCAFVALKGTIVLNFYELDEVVRAYNERRITTEEFRNILYGKDNEVKSCLTVEEVCETLSKLNFSVMKKRFDNLSVYVVAQRQ